jgi:proteasome accessory factor C
MSQSARDQVPRMLALVPYLRGRDGIPVEQVAQDFGVTPQQIVKDLNVLWFCGLPGSVSGDMIDVDMEALESEGVVFLDNAEYLPRPLRLTTSEALSLIVALRTLRDIAAPAELPTIESALAKLESATGQGAAPAIEVHIERADPAVHEATQKALATGRRMHLSYLVPSRDERTERDVDPLRLLTAEGRPYLEAWCHLAEDIRLFRLDRIVEAAVLEVAADPHPTAPRRDLSEGLFRAVDGSVEAVLDLSPPARWVAEYYPIESSEQRPDGSLRIRLKVGDAGWLRRLVLRQGGAARVVEPADLAEEVREYAQRALTAYGGD